VNANPAHASSRPVTRLHNRFLALLPRVELHGRIYFRHLRPHDKAEAVQEMRALAWQWFLRLHRRGRDPRDFLKGFTTLLARAVWSGRRLAGTAKAKDVFNTATQRRHGFAVGPLPDSRNVYHALLSSPGGQRLHGAFEERLRDNTVTPVPDQVQFRLDWPAWLATLTDRDRRMIRAMARNERTLDLSRRFGLSPARISQLRREYHAGWARFCGGV
jgi:hypothetical protein